MKKLLLTTLVTAMSITAAHAAPKVYGQLDVSINSIDDSKNAKSAIKVQSNASRFGIKGEDELTPTLSAVYQAEWEVSADNSETTPTTTTTTAGKTTVTPSSTVATTDLKARDRFVGIKHVDFGTLKAGQFDSNLKRVQGKVDLFNDTAAGALDITNTFAGENRLANAIGYESNAIKTLGGIKVNLLLQPGEETATQAAVDAGATATTYDDNGIADALSTSITWESENGAYYAGIADDSKVVSTWNATGGKYKTNLIRAVGVAKPIKGLAIGALYQDAKPSDDVGKAKVTSEKGYLLGAAYTFAEAYTAKLQYQVGDTKVVGQTSNTKINQLALGLDYAFSDKTKAYGYIGKRTTDTGASTTPDIKIVGVALLHKF